MLLGSTTQDIVMDVLSIVNNGKSTAIPIELAEKVNTSTEINVSVAAFYDDSQDDLDPDILESDIDVYTLGADSRFDFGAYRRLRGLLADFDILHTHTNSVGSLGRLAATGTGTNIVNTEHNDHQYFSHLQNIVNCPTYAVADVVVTNSRSTRDSFRTYETPFLKLTDCRTVYNGINFDRIDESIERADVPSLPDGKKVVTAAVIDEQKNLSTLVKAMDNITEEMPEAKLIVIGDGPLKPDLERMAEELDIASSTTFLGYLPKREQVYATMAQCDVFAVPSRYEGFCNAAVEAMGCGLPVVASDIAVLREVVGSGGKFADPHDPSAFANVLEALLRDDDQRVMLGDGAEQRARETFPIDRAVNEYANIYREVVS